VVGDLTATVYVNRTEGGGVPLGGAATPEPQPLLNGQPTSEPVVTDEKRV
jgi:hypothetical protein